MGHHAIPLAQSRFQAGKSETSVINSRKRIRANH